MLMSIVSSRVPQQLTNMSLLWISSVREDTVLDHLGQSGIRLPEGDSTLSTGSSNRNIQCIGILPSLDVIFLWPHSGPTRRSKQGDEPRPVSPTGVIPSYQ